MAAKVRNSGFVNTKTVEYAGAVDRSMTLQQKRKNSGMM